MRKRRVTGHKFSASIWRVKRAWFKLFHLLFKALNCRKKKAKTVDVNNPPKIEISSIGRMIFRISNMFGQVDELKRSLVSKLTSV